VMVRWLGEHGLEAEAFETQFGDEAEAAAEKRADALVDSSSAH